MPVSNTVNQFRQDVLGKGGPQISALYKVTMSQNGQSLFCYPLSVIIPGRQFVYYEHDLWGPNRKVPYKRGYTLCHMTFIAYQDWNERAYVERWMNTVVKHKNSAGIGSAASSSVFGAADPSISTDFADAASIFENGFINGSLSGNASFNVGEYDDYIQYDKGVGTIQIDCLNSRNKANVNMSILLKECFPAAISQMTIGSDGTGYPTFNVSFQFNDYAFVTRNYKDTTRVTSLNPNVDGGNPTPIQTPGANRVPVRGI
jgi:hypothetical protein